MSTPIAPENTSPRPRRWSRRWLTIVAARAADALLHPPGIRRWMHTKPGNLPDVAELT
jgi:hypothetical protein